ncbi:damage-inducible mutagenesis protein (plasmid) [Rhizobium ruizarguesonis]|uniref:ImuA family protein n=1 Tax=Rhizobium/Agrobacterium group TaxID=227290 RepID=UPI000DD8F02B|nr:MULTISPECIES: ImuA family protein [Rhizobium/Agrobacterium group]MDP9762498.1 protein ImuA [Agrobacterium tumefaciens]MDQ1220381.1 protein ImuA [Agrobacterium sp. SORGH_AS_0745]NKK81252.1 damage-inducible mutagenesis protein [Rhizobium leguminosarum bv. viciae]NTZ63516.1 damage-inducible mutagenesis protein [Agrobacterium tumefaciens]TAW83744.1 damage-inducible mutagenesis protein [Rhizobium ruizarguesonis]
MSRAHNPRVIEELRDRIAHLEGSAAKKAIVLPFGVCEMDEHLPGGGLSYGALHEIAGGGVGTVDGAAAALFAAGIAARSKGKVLWCLTRPDLFFPAIAQAGLHPDRVIFCEGDKEEDVLASMEEGLSFGGLAAVVGELVRLPMVASRRLQLAAEKTGTMGLVVRRWRRQTEASDFGNPTASTTRWRVSVLPSEALPVAGVGRARWLAELMRVKAGECAEFELGACDAKGRVCLLPHSVNRPDTTAWRGNRAS